jgi:hypothetical protein
MNLFIRSIALTIILFSSELTAQPVFTKQEPVKVTFHYNAVWELTTAENAMYTREAYFDLTDMVFEGVFNDYNKKGELIADGIYNQGVKSGIHTEYVNHTVKTKVEYSGNDFTIWEWSNGSGEGVKNGNGKFSMTIYYFLSIDGQIVPRQGVLHGEFLRGRRSGVWIYTDTNKSKTDKEVYSNGKLINHKRYDKYDSSEAKESKPIYLSLISMNTEILAFDKASFSNLNKYFEKYVTYPNQFNRNVTYPGGIKRLLVLLSNTMMLPEKNLELIRLKIDEHGQITKSTLMRSVNVTYDELTAEVLELHQYRFFPAIRNGKPEAATIYLPIAGGVEWERLLEGMPTEWFLNPENFY